MKARKILTILVLSTGIMFCLPKVADAETVGTAFTYQGRLIDANSAADGIYDFQFKLFDSITKGKQVGTDVNIVDTDVIDGYFTAELDFGKKAFVGEARWLEIGVRPGDMNDPNVYTTLSPRQEVTAAPYALYAFNGGGGSIWQVNGSDIYYNDGNVGIGTTSPTEKLEVAGDVIVKKIGEDVDISLVSGTTSSSKLLFGNRFEPGAVAIKFDNPTQTLSFKIWLTDDALVITQDGNIGIGTTNPGAKLDVDGDMKVSGAYKGDIGPNNGAPFPRPAYDSGWVSIARGEALQLFHNIGGNSDNYVVDMQGKHLGWMGVNIRGLGGDIDYMNNPSSVYRQGFYWYSLTSSYVYVFRFGEDTSADMVRLRIWVYN